jgi:hypothetical protein
VLVVGGALCVPMCLPSFAADSTPDAGSGSGAELSVLFTRTSDPLLESEAASGSTRASKVGVPFRHASERPRCTAKRWRAPRPHHFKISLEVSGVPATGYSDAVVRMGVQNGAGLRPLKSATGDPRSRTRTHDTERPKEHPHGAAPRLGNYSVCGVRPLADPPARGPTGGWAIPQHPIELVLQAAGAPHSVLAVTCVD